MVVTLADKLGSCSHSALLHTSNRPSQTAGRRFVVRVSAQSAETDRRSAILGLAATVISGSQLTANGSAAAKTATRQAADFCPPSATDGYVVYTPTARATPSLRAGVISPDPNLYSFEVPAKWTEGTILNISSGNFCMPKCPEPWTETLWESAEEGSAVLIISPLYRLVSKARPVLKDLGPPSQVIEQIGPFITGNELDSLDDVVSMASEEFADGKTYYTYELNASYAKFGTHQLAAFTAKGELAYLWVVAGNDKQWAKAESKLRYMLKSFTA